MVNTREFGLQAGVFTRSLRRRSRRTAKLDVGGVIVGDVPSFRADQMPYGGVKGSGVGREGLRRRWTTTPRSAYSSSPVSTCSYFFFFFFFLLEEPSPSPQAASAVRAPPPSRAAMAVRRVTFVSSTQPL